MISRKTASAIGIAGLVLLVTLPAFSQGPGRHSARRYNPATEVRETGTIEGVRQIGDNRGWTGTGILLKTQLMVETRTYPIAFIGSDVRESAVQRQRNSGAVRAIITLLFM